MYYRTINEELIDILNIEAGYFEIDQKRIIKMYDEYLTSGKVFLMDEQEKIGKIRKFIESTNFDGYQRIELPYDFIVPGTDKRSWAERIFDGIDFNNKTVLDVGSAYGAFSYEAIRRGANKVVALENGKKRFPIAKKISELMQQNIIVLNKDVEGGLIDEKYDITLLLNIIHHLLDPIYTIRKLGKATKELLIVEFPTLSNKKFIKRTGLRPQLLWLVRNYPLIGVGRSAYHNTFYISKEAFRNIFLIHHKLFSKIEFRKSIKDERWIAYCWLDHNNR